MTRKVKGLIFSAKPEFKVAEEERRIIEGYFSTKDVDRVDDVVEPMAFKNSLPKFVKKNGIVLFNHNYDYPIGKIIDYRVDNKGAFVKVEIAKGTNKAEEVWSLIKQGILKTFSFGFIPLEIDFKTDKNGEKEIRVIKDLDLLEVSIVSVPANAEATFTIAEGKAIGVSIGCDINDNKVNTIANILEGGKDKMSEDKNVKGKEVIEEKATSPFKDFPLADRNRPWDKTAAIARVRKWASKDGSGDKDSIDWEKYKLAFFWYDEKDPENFGSYKLPFVDIIEGKPYAVPRGVIAAAAAIQGARGGVDIPASDIPKVKRHIAKYYKKMDMTPPWENESKVLSPIELEVLVKETVEEVIEKVLMEKMEDKLEEFLEFVLDDMGDIYEKIKEIDNKVNKFVDNLSEENVVNKDIEVEEEKSIDEDKIYDEIKAHLIELRDMLKSQ